MKTHLVPALLLGSVLFLAGCEYDAPLTTDHATPIDPSILGIWTAQSSDETDQSFPERMVVLKFSTTEYVVHYQPSEKECTYYRGYPVRVGDVACVQLELLGSETGPWTNPKRFLVASYRIEDQRLAVRMLNDDVVGTDLEGSAAIRAAFLEHADDPKLFRDPGLFVRLADAAKAP